MPNFAVTPHSTGKKDSLENALAALKTQIETVDDTKTLRYIDVIPTFRDREQCEGGVIYDT
jgi:hypothetical protein